LIGVQCCIAVLLSGIYCSLSIARRESKLGLQGNLMGHILFCWATMVRASAWTLSDLGINNITGPSTLPQLAFFQRLTVGASPPAARATTVEVCGDRGADSGTDALRLGFEG
jgi:hypothetical protein